jgi:predicted nucleic-acid-binding protein
VIGLDSSVLVRYIAEDDPVWSEPASCLIDEECTTDRPGFVNVVVLAEVVWVLRRRPDFTRQRLAKLIQEFLDADNLIIDRADAVERSLERYKKSSAGFADCLIAELNVEAGAVPTVAIDKDAIRDDIFAPLKKR